MLNCHQIISNVLCFLLLVIIQSVSAEELSNEERVIFLGAKDDNEKYQICVKINSLTECYGHKHGSISRLWKIFYPYVAYEVESKNSSSIYFFSLRSGERSKKLTSSKMLSNRSLHLSSSGDRLASVEEAHFGDLLIIQGVFLNSSYEIVTKLSEGIVVLEWFSLPEIMYLGDTLSNEIVRFDIEDKSKEIILSRSESMLQLRDAAISKDGNTMAVIWDQKHSKESIVEVISNDYKKEIFRGKVIDNIYLANNEEDVIFTVVQAKEKTAIIKYGIDCKCMNIILETNYPIKNPVIY